ncbi:M90 family metallopeptidase [uncultured Shewanella sp.]|uniref:M90 family metallopeptidase n=1 Tax=uncultured Shewanella sp. TaxID=173975 RepID=UPI002602954D|nr:M90 family metallopeptidase [uncultured Shewanella sp.]
MDIFIIMLVSISAIMWILSRNWRVERKRNKIKSQPFPKAWRNILKQRFPYFNAMPTDLQLQLKQHIQVFVSEKTFVGCKGLKIDDEIRVIIAAQACLLLLNRKTDFYPKLTEILVYPSIFVVEHPEQIGQIVSSKPKILSGESWQNGKVILSWQTTQDNAAHPFEGNNVVIHEFAHQLDQENGNANGAPILNRVEDYQSWSKVLADEYASLVKAAQHQEESLFNYYGATNPAEFFAVISEVFFEKPHEFFEQHPALYRELSHFYKLNPIHWH